MHTLRSLPYAAAALLAGPAVAQIDPLYTVTASDGRLRTVSIVYATTVASVQIVRSTGPNAIACHGLARDPVSGQVYALVRFAGSAADELCSLDLLNGVATVLGPMADAFAGLAFRADGTLFGVTGDAALVPEALYTIDRTNAQATFVMALGNGTDGETIAFAPDQSLYHASGLGTPNTEEVFERIDLLTSQVANVPLSGHDYDGLRALTSYTGGNLIGVDDQARVVVITTAGHVSQLGTLDHAAVRGLVFVPSANHQPFFRGYGDGCRTAVGAIPMLLGCGVPTGGQSSGVHLRHAPTGSFGLLASGFGNGTLPVPSPACPVQVDPVLLVTGFVSGPSGEFDLMLALPPGMPPFDLFFQAGVLDGPAFVVSNPVQMHVQ